MAIASLIMGILALASCLGVEFGATGFGVIFSILGIIFGALAKKNPQDAGLAKVGIVLSVVALILDILITACCVVCVVCIGGVASPWLQEVLGL